MPRAAASAAFAGPNADRHEALHGEFRWAVPARLSIAEVCCDRWARTTPRAAAVRWRRADGRVDVLTYGAMQAQSRRLAAALAALGVGQGDRVAIVLPQRPETAVAHVAVQRLGAVAMPLSILFGPDAMAMRLADAEAVVAIADDAGIGTLAAARASCPSLRAVVAVGDAAGRGDVDWVDAIGRAAPLARRADTRADDAAVLIYTSGTTGPPKGAVIPQRALIGNLPGFVCSQDGFPSVRAGAAFGTKVDPVRRPVFWSPADWAWTGGLMDALLPTLYFGRTIVAQQGRFDPAGAFELMAAERVTNAFLFPTALKAMMKAVPEPRSAASGRPGGFDLALGAIMSAGEAVGDTVFAWCRDALGVVPNEMFGQTEINYVVGNCGALPDGRGRWAPGWPARPGSMGRAYPGHRVAVIDDDGRECPPGVPGDVAVHRLDRHGDPDPIFFAGYWRSDAATRAKFTGDPAASWCRTGDTAVADAAGYLVYQGRSDDVFKVAGYRIGPSEVENCLVGHPAVANAAVVPKPDAERGALVKAYVVRAPGHAGLDDDALRAQLQSHVRRRLAPYEYPKEVEFVDALPMTTTGKVQRRVLRLREEQRARERERGDLPPAASGDGPTRDRQAPVPPPRQADDVGDGR